MRIDVVISEEASAQKVSLNVWLSPPPPLMINTLAVGFALFCQIFVGGTKIGEKSEDIELVQRDPAKSAL